VLGNFKSLKTSERVISGPKVNMRLRFKLNSSKPSGRIRSEKLSPVILLYSRFSFLSPAGNTVLEKSLKKPFPASRSSKPAGKVLPEMCLMRLFMMMSFFRGAGEVYVIYGCEFVI
jgi:hypothetical protein